AWPSAARSRSRTCRGRHSCCARRRVEVYSMITVPAVRLHQFGVFLYQAILGARDVDRLVRFEVLSYDSGAHPAAGAKRKSKKASRVNWELLEKRIAASAEAYQRPIIKKKIAELVDYYTQCSETGNLPAIPGAVLLVADRRLEFTPTSSHRVLGVLEIPAEEGVLRALDGQHRLLALHQLIAAGQAEDVQVPAVIFDRLTPAQGVELFATINAKHTTLNPSQRFFLNYFKQIAAVFPRAWVGRKYSIKTGVALRAFLRVVPDVLKAIRDGGGDPLDAHAIRQTIKPWGLLVGDGRFETEGE